MRGSEKFVKEQVEPVDFPFTILDSGVGPLEFLSPSLPLTLHQIGIGQNIILISNTLHASKVFMTPVTTFEETPDQQRTTTLTSFHILSQFEPMEEANVEPIEGAINQLVAEN